MNDTFKKMLIPALVVAALLSVPAAALGQTPAGVTVAEPPGGLLEAAVFYIVALVAVHPQGVERDLIVAVPGRATPDGHVGVRCR